MINRIHALSLAGTICGSLLVGVPLLPKVASAQSVRPLNPCPGLFYQEPWNNRISVPDGCPPNGYIQRRGMTNPTRPDRVPAATTQPPLPEQRNSAVARVEPMNGTVSVKLINQTNAEIDYQVIGHTGDRTLAGDGEVELTGIPLPVTLTAVRQDNGLIDIKTQVSESGELEIMLNEEPNLGGSNLSIRIQEDGQVFVN
ncbi:MAG: hypothetical protein SW833_09355 [Cyanobacteriota bacterium]|nr:hypothetical protein [Cyanobacteriota bacterium]